MLNLRVAFGASRTSHVFFNFVQKSMLNLRAASRLSNLALFFAPFYFAQKVLNLRVTSCLSNLAYFFFSSTSFIQIRKMFGKRVKKSAVDFLNHIF